MKKEGTVKGIRFVTTAVLVLCLMSVFALASFTNTNITVSQTLLSNQTTYVGQTVSFLINVTNLNTTENATNVSLFDQFNSTYLRFNSSSIAFNENNTDEVGWLFNLSNMSSYLIYVNFTTISSVANTTNRVLIENTSENELERDEVNVTILGGNSVNINIMAISQNGGTANRGDNISYTINVSNNDMVSHLNMLVNHTFDSSRLNYTGTTAKVIGFNQVQGYVTYIINVSNQSNTIITSNFTAGGSTGAAQSNFTGIVNNTQEATASVSITINNGGQMNSLGNYSPLWSNAQPASFFSDNSDRFSFQGAPHVARGPGCSLQNLEDYDNSSAGYNCCTTKSSNGGDGCNAKGNVAYDLGAVWVEEDGDYLAWKIVGDFHKADNLSVCSGINQTAAYVVEFDFDDNSSTGCNNNYGEGCYPGADYQLWFFPDSNQTLFATYYNKSGLAQNMSYDIAFVENTTASTDSMWAYYNCSVDLGGENSTTPMRERGLTIVINKTALFGNQTLSLNFETNSFNTTEAATNPIDLLTDYAGGNFINSFAQGGSGTDQGACFEWDRTNRSTCESNDEGFSCIWTDLGGSGHGLCDPDFRNFGAGAGCFQYESSGACNTDAGDIGYCQWAPGSFPLANGSVADGLCIEEFNPFEFGGGDCDNNCEYCFKEAQCGNSEANGGQAWGGCAWYNDTYNPQGFCDAKNIKFGCTENSLHCLDSVSCSGSGWTWNTTYSICTTGVNSEICYNNGDDDGDSLVDCADPDCSELKYCGLSINTLSGEYKGFSVDQALTEKYSEGMGPVLFLKNDDLNDSTNATYEINGLAIAIADLGMGIGIMYQNLSKQIACGGTYALANLFPIDTDANNLTGCNITVNGDNMVGFEYVVKDYNYSEANTSSHSKEMWFCTNSSSNKWVFKDGIIINPNDAGDPESNQPLLASHCQEGNLNDPEDGPAAIIMFDKLAIGNPRTDIRFAVISVNGSVSNLSNISGYDIIDDAYYTPGSVNFEPIDCFQEPTKCGTEFIVVGGGEFMPFENCFAPGDEDLDGDTDCNDTDCAFAPHCAGLSSYNVSTDNTAPKVKMSKVDIFDVFVLIKWATNEPTNGSVLYYSNSTSCQILNTTLVDEGIVGVSGDDYSPFHHVPIDIFTIDEDLTPNSTYFYKLQSIDRAENKAISKCLNFTTGVTESNVTMVFNFTGNENSTFFDNLSVKVNGQTVTVGSERAFNRTNGKNVNLSFGNPNANSTNNWSITFIGVDMTEAAVLDLASAFSANGSGERGVAIGMDTFEYQNLKQKMGVDFLHLQIPGLGNRFYHCADNGSDCTDVTDQSGVLLIQQNTTGNYSIWKVPVNLGFSTYATQTVSSQNASVFTTTDSDEFSGNTSVYSINITLNSTSVNGTYNFTLSNSTTNATLSSIEFFNSSFSKALPTNIILNDTNQYYLRINFSSSSTNVAGLVNVSIQLTNATNATDQFNASHPLYLVGLFFVPNTSDDSTPTINVSYATLSGDAAASCTVYNLSDETSLGTFTTNANGFGQVTLSELSIHLHNMTVSCTNNGDIVNSTALTLNITLDTTNPSVSITSPANTTLVSGSVSFNVTVSEEAYTVLFSTDGGATNLTASSTDNLSWNYTAALSDGSYTLNAYVNDTSGNRNDTKNVSFSVDASGPVITINSPGTAQSSTTVRANVTLDEIGNVTFSLTAGATNFTPSTTDNFTWIYTFTSMSETSFVLTIYANDTFGNTNTTTRSFTVDLGTSSGSSGGSEASRVSTVGIGVHGGQIQAIKSQTFTILDPTNSAKNIVTIVDEDIPVTQIKLDVKSEVRNSRVTVVALKEKPSATSDLGGSTYKYMSITATNLNADNVNGADIGFSVPISFIIDNKATKEDVKLYRFTDSAWVQLETTYVGLKNGEHMYTAKSPGFSFFSVTIPQEKVGSVSPGGENIIDLEPETLPPQPVAEVVDDQGQETAPLEPKGKNPMSTWIVLIILVALGLVGVVHKRMQE
ncbi:MAG: PGF-pre-PGF domain-containing protein [Candidatus Woesearchaeota archaeon]|jgi:PGF-pre-PGF domain-containing protein